MPGFTFGECTLQPLSDGFFGLDGGAMFGVIPRVLWQQANPPDQNNRIKLALRPLLITTPKDRIVVDTGVGRKYGDRFNQMFNVDDSDEITRSLARQGVEPQDITVVVHTHLHFDHAGGTTLLDGHGKSVPRFPNARHLVQAEEWHDATHPNRRTQGSYRADDFMPVAEAGLVEQVEGDIDIGYGVRLMKTGGHTRGHQIVLVQGPDCTAVYWGDLVPTCSHVRIPYIMGYDLFPLVTMEQKERLIARAAAERWVCFFEHDPETAAATIQAENDAFAVKPILANEKE